MPPYPTNSGVTPDCWNLQHPYLWKFTIKCISHLERGDCGFTSSEILRTSWIIVCMSKNNAHDEHTLAHFVRVCPLCRMFSDILYKNIFCTGWRKISGLGINILILYIFFLNVYVTCFPGYWHHFFFYWMSKHPHIMGITDWFNFFFSRTYRCDLLCMCLFSPGYWHQSLFILDAVWSHTSQIFYPGLRQGHNRQEVSLHTTDVSPTHTLNFLWLTHSRTSTWVHKWRRRKKHQVHLKFSIIGQKSIIFNLEMSIQKFKESVVRSVWSGKGVIFTPKITLFSPTN